MSEKLKRLVSWSYRMITAIAVVGWGLLGMFWKRLPPEVPLWYSRPWGESQLARTEWLWLIPGLMWLVGVTAIFAAWRVNGRWGVDEVLTTIVLTTLLVSEAVLLLGLLRIIFLVI